jgi:hypothetical protein
MMKVRVMPGSPFKTYPERSEGSQLLENAKFFVSFRMTFSVNLRFRNRFQVHVLEAGSGERS